MEKSNPSNQESVGDQIIEHTSKLECFSFGEGVAVCEVCGDELREGASVVVFAFRPVEQPAFEVGHVKCVECRHEPSEYFTLGVREVVLDGRVGTCTDPATQPRAVSPPNATTVRPLPGVSCLHRPVARSDAFVAADCESTRKPWQRSVVRADGSARDGASEPDAGSTSDDTTETTAPHAADGGRQGGESA